MDLRIPSPNPTEAVTHVAEASSKDNEAADLVRQADYLIEVAARAPSLHNTQPWRFKVSTCAIELYADARRQLRKTPSAGRC